MVTSKMSPALTTLIPSDMRIPLVNWKKRPAAL
jgi:hypothetical protein